MVNPGNNKIGKGKKKKKIIIILCVVSSTAYKDSSCRRRKEEEKKIRIETNGCTKLIIPRMNDAIRNCKRRDPPSHPNIKAEASLSSQQEKGGGGLCGFECGREKSALDDEIQSRQI
jgi:hypothetical protein